MKSRSNEKGLKVFLEKKNKKKITDKKGERDGHYEKKNRKRQD
jgi:hypothetical protein